METIISYLIAFLLGEENQALVPQVSYGPSETARVVIQPSAFFDDGVYLTEKSLPALPLAELDGVPVLFGTPKVWEEQGQLHIGADLIASTYFLITRYEECVRRDVRDQHGRFLGRESLAYRAGFLSRPIVEEYGKLLRKYLRQAGLDVKEPESGFSHVYLTHDVDEIWTWDNYYRALRTTVKRILKNQPEKLRPLLACYDYMKYDPVYTFPWLIQQDDTVKEVYGKDRCTPLYFFMGCIDRRYTDRGYLSDRERTQRLISDLQKADCVIGCHTSYAASLDLSQVKPEVTRIAELAGNPITRERHHYLASREPEDFNALIQAGITDDFTMGYADTAGFRLGTCRPVRWIDPIKRELTALTLHPMTVMECTLDNENYMGIADEETAFSIVKGLLQQIYTYNGEVVLLWHSPSVYPKPNSYQRSLYVKTLQFLRELKRESIAE